MNPMGPPITPIGSHIASAPAAVPQDIVTKSYMDQVIGSSADFSQTIPDVEDLKKRMMLMETRLNTLIEAIALNHVGHPVGGHSDACWSCKILDAEKGLKVANRLMENAEVPA